MFDLGDGAGSAQHLGGERAALGLIGVEQRGGGVAVDDQSKLPGEILDVAEPGQHPLPAERCMGVSGVAGDQHPAPAIGVGEPAVHAEHRQPVGVDDADVATGPFGQHLLEPSKDLLLGRFVAGLAWVIGDDRATTDR